MVLGRSNCALINCISKEYMAKMSDSLSVMQRRNIILKAIGVIIVLLLSVYSGLKLMNTIYYSELVFLMFWNETPVFFLLMCGIIVLAFYTVVFRVLRVIKKMLEYKYDLNHQNTTRKMMLDLFQIIFMYMDMLCGKMVILSLAETGINVRMRYSDDSDDSDGRETEFKIPVPYKINVADRNQIVFQNDHLDILLVPELVNEVVYK